MCVFHKYENVFKKSVIYDCLSFGGLRYEKIFLVEIYKCKLCGKIKGFKTDFLSNRYKLGKLDIFKFEGVIKEYEDKNSIFYNFKDREKWK